MHQYALRVRLRGGRRRRGPRLRDERLARREPDEDPDRQPGVHRPGAEAVPAPLPRRAGDPLGGQPRLGEGELRGPPLERDGDRVAGADRTRRRSRSTCPASSTTSSSPPTPGPATSTPGARTSRSGWSTRGRSSSRPGRSGPREGITVEIAMPSDAVDRPGLVEGALLVAGRTTSPMPSSPRPWRLCFLSWFFRGRDLPGTGTIVVNYEAPDGLRPAEVGTLIDEKVDLRDISATIIDLAVRGYLRIEELELAAPGSRSGSDYRFIKLKGPRRAQGLREEAVRQDLRRRRQRRAERSPGEVLPGARAGQGRPLSGAEQGPASSTATPRRSGGRSSSSASCWSLAVLAAACRDPARPDRPDLLPPGDHRGDPLDPDGGDHQPGHAAEDAEGADRLGEDRRAAGVHPPRRGGRHPASRSVRASSSGSCRTPSSSACRSGGARRSRTSIASPPTGISRPGRRTSRPGC